MSDEARLPKWRVTTRTGATSADDWRTASSSARSTRRCYFWWMCSAASATIRRAIGGCGRAPCSGVREARRLGWRPGRDELHRPGLHQDLRRARGEPLKLQFRTRFESRYYRQILYTFVEDKVAVKTLLREFGALPETLQDVVYGFTGECRACGFCNQTNRKLQYNNVPAVYVGGQSGCAITSKRLGTRELTRERLDEARALYAWMDGRYEAAPPRGGGIGGGAPGAKFARRGPGAASDICVDRECA